MTTLIAVGCLLITFVMIATFFTRPPDDDSSDSYSDDN